MTTGPFTEVSREFTSVKGGCRIADRTWTLRGAIAIALFMALAGCQTPPPSKSASEDQHAEITLREGDAVRISFPGAPNLDTPEQVIRRDGKITLPIVGEVMAAGLTTTELKKALLGLFADQLLSKEIDVTVISSTFSVYVDGAVNRPGKVTADHPLTAFEAIMESGGFDYTKANMRKIMIIRHKRGSSDYTYLYLDLKAIIDGDKADLFYLAQGDTIHVPEKFSWF